MSTLTPAQIARYSVEAGWWCGIQGYVRWSDSDPFGHMNHIAYLEWFQDCRNVYLEAVGLPPLSAGTPGPVLTEVTVNYRKSLSYGDRFLVTAKTLSVRNTSFRMGYALWREGSGLAATGSALAVLTINATGERVAIPQEIRRTMIERDGAKDDTTKLN